MEFAVVKRARNRRKRRHVKRRRRERQRSEVKSRATKTCVARDRFARAAMQADSFWKNYNVAQEWQKRHSVTWWKTRCFALEYENQILRDKVRSLASETSPAVSLTRFKDEHLEQQNEQDEEEEDGHQDNLEFHVNEELMSFLEQSIKHKIELKKKKESESRATEEEDQPIQGGAAWMKARNENARLLYGEASPTILAMETALQTTIDRHKDKAKPQYWPVIPLKP